MDVDKKEWRYKTKEHDPEEAKKAYEELEKAEDDFDLIDIEDEYDCPVKGVSIWNEGKEQLISCGADADVHLDYKQLELGLPKNTLKAYNLPDENVTSKQVRYCGMPTIGFDLPKNYGDLVVLSLWNANRDIVNMHLVTEGAKASMILLNALTRFIYESNEKNAVRTHKFYPICEGPIDVAFCSTDERDMRDALKQRKDKEKEKIDSSGTVEEVEKKLESDAANEDEQKEESEELPDLQKTGMYFVFDEEAILLYENPCSTAPLHDFRFYREAVPRAIDTIFVCNTEDQLEIQQGDNVFFIYPRVGHERSVAAYTELVETLRSGSFKPKSEEIFKGSGKDFEKFFMSAGKDGKGADDVSPDSEPDDVANDDPRTMMHPMRNMPERSMPFRPEQRSMPPRGGPMMSSDESAAISGSLPWLNNLNTGDHLLSNVSEDMQMMWFTVEPELESVISENKVPHIEIESSGMNPQSSQHLQTAVEDIRDRILSHKFAEAVSHLRGCMTIYGMTLLSAAESAGEIELLKRIYFLTG